jgi:hypothetical protein
MAGNINSGRKTKDSKRMPKTFRVQESTLDVVAATATKMNTTENEIVEKAIELYINLINSLVRDI